MNHLAFYLTSQQFPRVQILVDGQDVLLHALGLEQYYTYMPAISLYESLTQSDNFVEDYGHLPEEEGKTFLYTCCCQVLECDGIYVNQIEQENRVIWENFENIGGQQFIHAGPFEFSKENYEACLTSLRSVVKTGYPTS